MRHNIPTRQTATMIRKSKSAANWDNCPYSQDFPLILLTNNVESDLQLPCLTVEKIYSWAWKISGRTAAVDSTVAN